MKISETICPICYDIKRPDQWICKGCNDEGLIETGIAITKIKDESLTH